MTFAEKCAQPGVVSGWGFDLTSRINNFGVASDHALSYVWGHTDLDPVCTAHFSPVTSGSITFNRGSTEALCVAYGNYGDGICHYPKVDNVMYHAAGGGTGSLKFDIPSNSGAGTGGYIWLPYQGLGTSFYIGPDHANGGQVWIQWRERVDAAFIEMISMPNEVIFASATKQLLIFGNPPGGNDSSPFEITPAIQMAGGLFVGTGQQGFNHYFSDSPADCPGNFGLQQGGPLGSCCKNNAFFYGDYPEPRCQVIHEDHWYEMTYHCQLRPWASDFIVSGNHLISSTAIFVESVHAAGQQMPVFIVGDAAGVFHKIVTVVSPTDAILEDTPVIQGSGKSVYISNEPNTLIQAWVDGIPYIDFGQARVYWGPWPSSPTGYGLGFGALKFQPHATGKNPAAAHTNGYRWIDDAVISTQSIVMGTNGEVEPPPATGQIVLVMR